MLRFIACAFLACSVCVTAAGNRVAGYFPYWLQYSQYTPDQVRFDFLTEVRYASLIPTESGELTFADENDASNMERLAQLAEEKKVDFIISVSGAGNEDALRAMAGNESAMASFVESAKQNLEKYNAEGIEVDWVPEEDSDYDVFKKVVSALAEVGIATSANLSGDVSKISSYGDVLAKLSSASIYFTDQASAEAEKVEVNANLQEAKNVLSAYIEAGVAADKLMPIVPMYGKTFYKASGLGSSFDGVGSGSDGVISYNELMKIFDTPDYQVTFDEASWSEVAVSANETIVFNGIPSLKAFAEYVKDAGIGGIAVYDLSGDHVEPIVSLMVTIGKVLRPEVNYTPKKKKK